MKKIDEILNGVSCMAIAGHVRPDGDCIGSCLGLYQYLRDNRPEIQADVLRIHGRNFPIFRAFLR